MNINKLMRHYRCDAVTASTYITLRLQGYPRSYALEKSGLSV